MKETDGRVEREFLCVHVHVCVSVCQSEREGERASEGEEFKCVCCLHPPFCHLKVGKAGCMIGHSSASLSQSSGLADRSVELHGWQSAACQEFFYFLFFPSRAAESEVIGEKRRSEEE